MKRYLISLLLLILLYSGNAQPEWHWYNPRPDGMGLRGICVLDSTHAWAVGKKGRILFYDGMNWNPQESNTDKFLLSVSFYDSETGYAVGDSGTILKYQDGEWEDISVPFGYFNKVLMTRATDGWITGDTMLRLVNGVWTGYPYPGEASCADLEFTSPNNGYLSDYHNLFHFDGESWAVVEPPSSNFFREIRRISFSDKDHGMLIADVNLTDSKIIRYDHGTWEELTDPGFTPDLVEMLDTCTTLISSPDFDEETYPHGWSMLNYHPDEGFTMDTLVHAWLLDMHSSPDGMAGAVGYFGNIFLYRNGQWNLSNSMDDDYITCMDFPDDQHGWAVHSGGTILKWLVNEWQIDTIVYSLNFQDVQFSDPGYGWASGWTHVDYFLVKTVLCNFREGQWHMEDTIPAPIEDIFVLDRTHAWAVGRNALYFYDGHTWVQQFPGGYIRNFKAVFAFDPEHVWAAGEGHMWAQAVVWNYDGVEWKPLNEDLTGSFSSLWACDTIHAFITERSDGIVLKINRITGELTEMPTMIGALTSIHMFDALSGWVCSDYGMAAYLNAGQWIPVDFGSGSNLKVVTFSDPSHGWIGGHEGAMLSTYAWSPVSSRDYPRPPSDIYRLKVYPNPASAEVFLSWYLPVPEQVNISIISLNGEPVINVLDAFQGDGWHTLRLNCDQLPPGIYLCHVNGKAGRSIQKLIKR